MIDAIIRLTADIAFSFSSFPIDIKRPAAKTKRNKDKKIMKSQTRGLLFFLLLWATGMTLAVAEEKAAESLQTIWLTRRSNDPDKIVVNWLSEEPGPSVVRYGLTSDCPERAEVAEKETLHHVEIDVPERERVYYYKVQTGEETSSVASFRSFPTDVLKVAVVGDLHGRVVFPALERDKPHLLVTGGDNISNTWKLGGEGNQTDVKSYAQLIDANREFFRSTPFMPTLGNHDHEFRPRGEKFPSVSSYDIDATAFCRFFPLPNEGWKWRFDVPEFSLCFLTLDLNHLYDFGTTWQPCHPFDENSEQFRWYQKMIADQKPDSFVVTIYNERNANVRETNGGIWGREFQKGTTVCLTGFGSYYERAQADGVTYFNTNIFGRGDKYPDPKKVVFESVDHYLLLTFDAAKKTMTVEAKNQNGEVFDRVEFN